MSFSFQALRELSGRSAMPCAVAGRRQLRSLCRGTLDVRCGVVADMRPHFQPIVRRARWCAFDPQSRPVSEKHRTGHRRNIRTTLPRDWVDRCLTSGATLKEEETTNAALTTRAKSVV
jgi:hypothetical protein